jgi:hypothetical protein
MDMEDQMKPKTTGFLDMDPEWPMLPTPPGTGRTLM